MDSAERLLRAAASLRVGRAPGWDAATEAVRRLVDDGDLAALERVWPHLDGERRVLGMMAWRGRVYCGPAGARAFLDGLAAPPPMEGRTDVEDHGVLLGFACAQDTLATLVPHARGPGATAVAVATEERALYDGAVTEPTLVGAWTGPAHRLHAHPWEASLLGPPPAAARHDTLGNWRWRGRVPSWPEGGQVTADAPPAEGEAAVEVARMWTYDEEFDRVGPANPPPVGPFADPLLYPNGATWCVEGWSHAPVPRLGAWPFPRESVDVEVVGEEVSPEVLFRQWLWRGLTGGAYGSRLCARRARDQAWGSLATLAGVPVEAGPDAIAAAASSLRVYGFRARGPQIEALGGDFGFVAWRPDGSTWAAVHSDTD